MTKLKLSSNNKTECLPQHFLGDCFQRYFQQGLPDKNNFGLKN